MKLTKLLATLLLTIFFLLFPVVAVSQEWWLSVNYTFLVPSDTYGLTPYESYQKAVMTLDYISGKSSKSQLLEQVSYNQREIIHLEDVRYLYLLTKRLLILSLIGFLTIGLLKTQILTELKSIITFTSLLLVGVLGVIVVGSLFFWDIFFDMFHQLLFKPGTWMFYEDDWLIRLFPEIFWFSTALLLGIFYILTAALLYLFKRLKL